MVCGVSSVGGEMFGAKIVELTEPHFGRAYHDGVHNSTLLK